MIDMSDEEKEMLYHEIVLLKSENLILTTRLDKANESLKDLIKAIQDFVDQVKKRNHDELLR